MTGWRAAPELRWATSLYGATPPRLQQKWIEVGPHAVVDPPGLVGYAPARIVEGRPTGRFEWRDVPTVTEVTT